MSDLNDSQKTAIQDETRSTIKRIATFFGIANVAVLLGALWSFWTYAQSQVDTISTAVKEDVFEDLTTSRDELRFAVNEANQLIGRLIERAEDMDDLDARLENLKNRFDQLEDEELVAGASAFLTTWDGSRDVDQLVRSIDTKIDMPNGFGCASPRVYSAVAPKASLDWQPYKDNPTSTFVAIDTSAAGFTKTPLYFASLTGGGSWSAQGASAIYGPSADRFSIYLKWSPSADRDMVAYASDRWEIYWMAIGC